MSHDHLRESPTVAAAIAQYLCDQGVERVFSLPGSHMKPIWAELHARGVVQGRFIEKGVGTAKIARVVEVLEAAGIEVRLPELDERVADWARLNALPPARATHASDWNGRTPR